MRLGFVGSMLVLAVVTGAGGAFADSSDTAPEGVFTLSPVFERSCVAVRIPVTKVQALAGFKWWNNDADVAFPVVLVASGLNDVPPLYSDGHVVGTDVGGVETGWSKLLLSEPMASDTGTLYLVFQIPVDGEGSVQGEGTGFGYVAAEEGGCIWVSPDGDDWLRVATSYQLLVEPMYTDRQEGTLALKCSRPDVGAEPEIEKEEVPVAVVTKTELLVPFPNPFNPTTTVAFTLLEPGRANIAIYDLRGRLVRELLDEYQGQGIHEVQWHGDAAAGHRVASGVYFARMRAGRVDQIQRVTLVK